MGVYIYMNSPQKEIVKINIQEWILFVAEIRDAGKLYSDLFIISY